MTYLRIHCESCGWHWEVFEDQDFHAKQAATCPRCKRRIDYQTWKNQIVPAFAMAADANRELIRDATGFHSPYFHIDIIADYFMGKPKSF